MSERPEPVCVSVVWDGRNVELKLLSAIDALFVLASEQGLTPGGAKRVAAFVQSATEGEDVISRPTHLTVVG